MFARAALASVLLSGAAAAQLSIPLGKAPRQIDRTKAPIEESGPQWAAPCKDWDEWDKPAPPVRIHANTYLVGTCGISAILITGNEGHVLIDAGTEQGAELIADNIRQLGFRLGDIKYLLMSHEHFDHVGGIASVQYATGAKVYSSPAATKTLHSGLPSADDPQAASDHPAFRPLSTLVFLLEDGKSDPVGPKKLKPIVTPGHTPGALSWRRSSIRLWPFEDVDSAGWRSRSGSRQ